MSLGLGKWICGRRNCQRPQDNEDNLCKCGKEIGGNVYFCEEPIFKLITELVFLEHDFIEWQSIIFSYCVIWEKMLLPMKYDSSALLWMMSSLLTMSKLIDVLGHPTI